jgi:AraC-like DNA-binding protein
MRIQAYLPNASWEMLAGALPVQASAERLVSAQALAAQFERGDYNALAFDPAEVREDLFERMLVGLEQRPGAAVILFPASGMVALRITRMACVCPVEVCFVGEGNLQVLRVILRSLGEPSVPARLFHFLAGSVAGLPRDLRTTTTGLFCNSGTPCSVAGFCALTGAASTTLNRQLKAGGLNAVKRLIDVAQASRTWRHLESGRLSLGEVARRVGYSATRTMDSHFDRLVGLAPVRSTKELSAFDFARRLSLAALR